MKNDLVKIFFKDRNPQNHSKPIIIAHRGASGYEPENTLRAFRRALKMGSSMIELDVFLCKSEKLEESIVVIHDPTIDRTTNGHGNVREIPWEILKKYDAGKGEHIPLLTEVLDLVDKEQATENLVIIVELKGPGTAKPVAEIIKYYINNKNWSYNNFIVSSFNLNAIQEFKEYIPQIKTGGIFYKSKSDVLQIIHQVNAQYLILDYQSVTYNLIKKAHSEGIFVFVYTVNDAVIAQELATWDVDGIVTNYPDILKNIKFDITLH